jgi:dihydrofolate synthase/folylpolyglutamate synthase
MTSIEHWLDHIGSQHNQAIDLTLSRVAEVADKLQLRSSAVPIITVGGTNGKGTTVALLTNILQQSGYNVGTFTSPHVLHFNERIAINHIPASDDNIIQAFEMIEQARGNTTITYFEYSFLAALIIFKTHPLDVMILEVGLGGRLDAVNILNADIALITTIDIDHADYLGDTRELIGYEKAGIFRQNKPAICGELPTNSMIDYAKHLSALLEYPYHDFVATLLKNGCWAFRNKHTTYSDLPQPAIPLPNAALALQALTHLPEHFVIPIQAIQKALINTHVPGRFQCFEKNGVKMILDVAHNPHATHYLAQRLQTHCGGKTFAVVSMLADKAIADSIRPLKNTIDHWYFGGLTVTRGLTGEALANIANKLSLRNDHYDSVSMAYHAALSVAQPGDCILVFGSFHTVAAILPLFISSTHNA